MASYVPPRDAYELQVAVTAASATDRRDVGAFDDLVELGLSREAATRMAERLAARLGRRLSAEAVLAARTVAEVAAAYRACPKTGTWSSLVTIREARGQLPLVFVHPIGGNAFWYLNLCRKLEQDRGLYGFQARGLDLTEVPHRGIEEMAAAYAAELRAAVPHGPYVLAGWSFGGLVAFEVARQLAAAGEPVPLAVLFDVGPHDRGLVPATREAAWGLLVHALRLDRFALRLMALPERERAEEVAQLALRSHALPAGCGVAEVERMLELNLVHLEATERYEPGAYAGDLLVFASGDRAPGGLGWEAVTSGAVRVHPLPGTHFDALNRTNHDEIAGRLRAETAGIGARMRAS